MNRFTRIALACAVLLATAWSAGLQAEPEPPIRVGAARSDFKAERAGQLVELQQGDAVQPQDVLETGRGKGARVGFRGGIALHLSGKTRVRVAEFDEKTGRLLLELEKGQIRINRPDREGMEGIEVRTPNLSGRAGAGEYYFGVDGNSSEAMALVGSIDAETGGQQMLLTSGQMLKVEGGGDQEIKPIKYWVAYYAVQSTRIRAFE